MIEISKNRSLIQRLKRKEKASKMACLSRFQDFWKWQGQKDLNPRHAVLETAALPTELYPYLFPINRYA